MTWRPQDKQGNEARKIKYEIVKYTRGRGLDLGCGMWKTYPHFIGVDDWSYWLNAGIPLTPADEMALHFNVDVRADCSNLDLFASSSMDFVFSSHVLEHIENYKKALKEWWRLIRPGGHLVLYLPHKDYYPNIGEQDANIDHKHDFIPDDIISAMHEIDKLNLTIRENQTRGSGEEYSFYLVFQKLSPSKKQVGTEKPKKTCGVVRYGGFGDMIQTSSVLIELKKLGFHITVYTTPQGHDILKTDPNVDDFYIQDHEQVPNEELKPFWDVQMKKFDRWVNFSESVEGTFLAMPGRPPYYWSTAARHKYMNINYLEFMHTMAGVPYRPNPKFYYTDIELHRAKKRRKKMDADKVLMWVLSGSSVHKVWPHMDQILANIMLYYPSVKIVLSGDDLSSILEQGWDNEPRIIKTSGKWSIRDTITFACTQADVVVGPETGVMNAVAMLDVWKILFLSHSSKENLSKHWKNTHTLEPEGCACFPCHQMHHGFDHCRRDEDTGVSLCQSLILPDSMMQALRGLL